MSSQISILLFTMASLKRQGSWCGETHVQKAVFLCQEMIDVPSHFKFVLYKHGPYSFEVSECLQGLIADDLVEVHSRPPYGPSLEVSNSASVLLSKISNTQSFAEGICFLSQKLGSKGVVDLEKLATAVYVNKKYGNNIALSKRAEILNSIKPHVAISAAEAAFVEIDAIGKAISARSFQSQSG